MRYPARAQGSPKIGGDVVPRSPRNDGIAENLIDDLQDAPGCFVTAFHFQRPEHGHDILHFQPGDGRRTDKRENIVAETVHDRSLMLCRECRHACGVPFAGNILKTVPFGNSSGFLLLSLVCGWIDTLSQKASGFIAALSGILERYGRIGPETEEPAFALKAVGHAPELAAAGRNEKKKTAAVGILVGLVCGLQTADTNVGKRHGVLPGLCWMFRYLSGQKIQQYSLVIREGITLLHSMDLPSDIPLQELDATGQTWTTGNPVDTKKERIPMCFAH